jgi:hypothetical protein
MAVIGNGKREYVAARCNKKIEEEDFGRSDRSLMRNRAKHRDGYRSPEVDCCCDQHFGVLSVVHQQRD